MISGGTTGITGFGSITNLGTISGGTNSVLFTGGTGVINTLTLDSGAILTGDASGSTAGATNKLVLKGNNVANNNFRNFNSLDVQGSWVLNGASEVGVATIQSGGTLGVGGPNTNALLTGNVTVNSGAELRGFGTIAGDVTVAGGVIAPGLALNVSGNIVPVGALTVNGNVTFGANSIYRVNANSDGTADKLAVGGTAQLGGTVVAKAGGTFAPSTQYTILTASGGFAGTAFGGVSASFAFLTPTLTQDANNVFLTLALNNTGGGGGTGGGSGGAGGGTGGGGGGTGGGGGGPVTTPAPTGFGFARVAQTRNQNAVANSLNGGAVTNSLVLKILNQTIQGARIAFDALSGELFGTVQNAQSEAASFTRSGILGRLRQASYADAPGELGALGFAGPELAYADVADARAAYAADANGLPVKAPRGGNNNGRDLTFWAQGLGGWGHADSDGNAASLKSRFGGFLSGADMRFGEMWRAGLVAGYTRTDLDVDNRLSSGGIDSVIVGAYAGGKLGAINVRGGGSYSYDRIDTSRTIAFPGLTDSTHAHFHGGVGQLFGEVGYGLAMGNIALEPFAGLAYVHVQDGSFRESGGLAALSASSAHENLGYSTLGLRAATFIPLANGTALVPRGSVQWQHAFGDVTPTTGLVFQSTGTAFTVAGLPVARDAALVEGGFDWRINPWAKLGAFYQGDLAAHAQAHAVKGTFTWDF